MALYEEFEPQPNRLITAQSAYLRSAAYQPVGWYAFGPEPFEEARRQDKPVLLDIGAAWCHWCHVIDRESYENPEIATLINELFIPVKVDRDERPDIDARYQAAVHQLTGEGGWPLTVFLTPDGEPFYGGTYFPSEEKYGRAGFKTLLPTISDAYKHRRHELDAVAHKLIERTRASETGKEGDRPLDEEIFREIADGIRLRFNGDHGGFERGGPKFPHAGAIELALIQWHATGEAAWRTIVERTLTEMGKGGIYDQLDGGFHRYSVDATWTVPHFEKMGYDNALLLMNYVHAFRAFGNDYFREIAEGTLDFILRDLADTKRGGFFSTQDADVSLQDDGSYWTWTFAEIRDALTPEELAVLTRYYGVDREGDIPESHRNVLRINESPKHIARQLDLPQQEVEERIARGKRKLQEVRRHRKAPFIDRNKYANWNALLISACLEAGTLLENDEVIAFALRSAERLIADAYEPDHGIYHQFHGEHGADIPGFFEDQVYAARALLDAFSVSGESQYFDTARHLMNLSLEQYWDEDGGGGFLDVARDRQETAVVRFLTQSHKAIEDMPTPSPNAVAAFVLDRLWLLTHDDRYHDYARRTLEHFAARAPEYGPFGAMYAMAVFYHFNPPAMAVIIGPLEDARTHELRRTALSLYRPGRMVATFSPDGESLPYPAGKGGRAIAYVCAGETCAEPTSDAHLLGKRLETFGMPENDHQS